jgi:hypothetical protein
MSVYMTSDVVYVYYSNTSSNLTKSFSFPKKSAQNDVWLVSFDSWTAPNISTHSRESLSFESINKLATGHYPLSPTLFIFGEDIQVVFS